ncbi:hypothetical protein [Treponema sp. C6A8]|uniref:hypothetical protein n=1 Tax=Treponema sp. C6A8 TaxID=1410609 RepID=UPI00048930CF|nr:hypothetical protein [Treponema sp. C6A8]
MANVQVSEAINLTNQILGYVEQAERSLSSARNWGFFDVLGGGFITDLIKHSKLNRARSAMDDVNYLMQRLQQVLGSIQMPADYRMEIGNFATFADFFFDGVFADVYMVSKIMQSLDEVRRLKGKLYELKAKLEGLRIE